MGADTVPPPSRRPPRWPPPLLLADGTPDHDMLDAMAEVDALTPSCPPISPGIRNQMGPWPAPPEPWPDPPEAECAEVYPHGRPRPMPTPTPGPGQPGSR